MKNSLNRLITSGITVFIIGLFAISTYAQTGQYYVVQYIKVVPNMENEYLNLESDVWKKMHQARIDEGLLDGWHLYRVVSPNGTNTEYNYITVLIYSTADKLAGHFENYGVDYTKILTSSEISLALKTPEIRELVYEEVWENVDLLSTENPDHMFKYIRFNAMKTKSDDTDSRYVEIEQDYWKPIHQKRIDLGSMHGWGLFHMIIPGGTTREYTWATTDFYDRFIDIMNDDLNDKLFNQTHGKKNAEKYTAETLDSRDLLRTEIRELLDYVVPQNF